jgi:putative membrane protein
MVLRTAFLAFKGRFANHVRIAKWTFPAWMYVSITGVVVYFMLYH